MQSPKLTLSSEPIDKGALIAFFGNEGGFIGYGRILEMHENDALVLRFDHTEWHVPYANMERRVLARSDSYTLWTAHSPPRHPTLAPRRARHLGFV
jgi:hypothetical protein